MRKLASAALVAGTTLALLAGLGAFAVSMSFSSSSRVVSPAELGDAGGGSIQVEGTVVRRSLRSAGGVTEFVIAGGGRRVRVRYAGAAPDSLAPGRRVTATGRYERGVLIARADALRVSCDGGQSEQHC